MTNRLTKQDMLVYVDAVPPTPYIPAYRKVIQTWPAPWDFVAIHEVVGDADGGAVRGDVVGDTYVAYTFVPAQPATPGAPAYTIDNGVAAWNSGGRSTAPLDGDGAFRFQTNHAPGGIACGLGGWPLPTMADGDALHITRTKVSSAVGVVRRHSKTWAVCKALE